MVHHSVSSSVSITSLAPVITTPICSTSSINASTPERTVPATPTGVTPPGVYVDIADDPNMNNVNPPIKISPNMNTEGNDNSLLPPLPPLIPLPNIEQEEKQDEEELESPIKPGAKTRGKGKAKAKTKTTRQRKSPQAKAQTKAQTKAQQKKNVTEAVSPKKTRSVAKKSTSPTKSPPKTTPTKTGGKKGKATPAKNVAKKSTGSPARPLRRSRRHSSDVQFVAEQPRAPKIILRKLSKSEVDSLSHTSGDNAEDQSKCDNHSEPSYRITTTLEQSNEEEAMLSNSDNEESMVEDMNTNTSSVDKVTIACTKNHSEKPRLTSMMVDSVTVRVISKQRGPLVVKQCLRCPYSHIDGAELVAHMEEVHASGSENPQSNSEDDMEEDDNTLLYLRCNHCDFVACRVITMWYHFRYFHYLTNLLNITEDQEKLRMIKPEGSDKIDKNMSKTWYNCCYN